MKLTKQQLKQIIREELRSIMVPNALLKSVGLWDEFLPDDIRVPVDDADLERIPDNLRQKYGSRSK